MHCGRDEGLWPARLPVVAIPLLVARPVMLDLSGRKQNNISFNIRKYSSIFLHIVDFNGGQWVKVQIAVSKGSTRSQPRNKGII